ncbi:MAG: SDR family NAD(P)-dependent oxidoreductase [Acidobacteria bacterium]|nr:MAG: SDR family NAD(P)-dependent oxidoreductase [Acidobacteriota bacterium]REK06185.1 MAG: SDR family NAD(P)-dependent oxidoreductase [Acidobacteriota bacterium]
MKTPFDSSTALVTGGASGIGRALCEELLRRGAEVWLTDVDAEAAAAAARALGGGCRHARLDVRDAQAFRELVHEVAASGGLGFLFNNAGIGVGGEAHQLGVEHYDRVIDVNVRGVTNGVAAAYPLMVEQGSGHIVNTASASGLVPVPLLAPYAMSKHAVVGLSTSLSFEAERHGVGVHALCPGPIETPLLDSLGPGDLPEVWRPDVRAYLELLAGRPISAGDLARQALDAVARGRRLIVLPRSTRVAAVVARLLPGLVHARIRSALRRQLSQREAEPARPSPGSSGL